MEDNLLFKKQIRFNTNDFCAGNILPNVVFKAFETIATEHANLLGVGGEQMLLKNLFWVIMRAKYQIVGNILPNEPIILSTAPQTTNMFEFDRDFFIHDQNGNLLLKGTSKWCVVDAKTRRLAKMTDLCLPVASHIDRAFDQKFLKTQIFETDFSPDYVFAVKH